MSSNPLIMRVRAALKTVKTPNGETDGGSDVVSAGLIRDLSVSPAGVAKLTIDDAGLNEADAKTLTDALHDAASSVDGVSRTVIVGDQKPGSTPPQGSGGHSNPLGLKNKAAADSILFPGVKTVLAVASGKGGVGKSTFAANLAHALHRQGRAVGLLDADIYGPSLPTLLGAKDVRPSMVDGKIQPVDVHGLKTMSIGYLVSEEKALAWRGPMVMGALRQLMGDVDWGALDILIIDTPPGTGDVHLSLGQTKRLNGAIIVSTPQEMALADVRRGVEFFRKVNVPILGVIENMAWLEMPDGARQYIFGKGGAEDAARSLDAPFLGALPLMPDLREASDNGAPAGQNNLAQTAAAHFDKLAKDLADMGSV